MIIKFHQAHKTHRSTLKTSWKNPVNTMRTSREHLENIKRTSTKYLEKIQKHLWSSVTSVKIWELLSTSRTHRISIEYLWSIEDILKTSENSWEHLKTSDIIPRKKFPLRGWLCIAQGDIGKQLRTSENNYGTSKNIGFHPLRSTEDPSKIIQFSLKKINLLI